MKKQEKSKTKPNAAKAEVTKPKQDFWQKKYFLEGLVFCFCFLLFANSITNDYNLDDELVTMNHRLTSRGISAIPDILTSPYYQDQSGYSYEYRPIVLISFAVEHQIFGDNAHVSHFWNVLLYCLCCVILFRALCLFFRDYSPLFALAVTLLFAAHPAHTEVVASIKNRDEIFGLLFGLLTFIYAIKLVRDRNSLAPWFLVPVFFVLSLLSKLTFLSFALIIPMAIVLFEDFDLVRMLFIVFSLVTPVLIISDLGTTLQKISIIIAGLVGVCIIGWIRDFSGVNASIRNLLLKLTDRNRFSISETGDQDQSFSTLFKFSPPPFSLKVLLTNIILLGAFTWAVFFDIYLIQVLVALVWAVCLFSSDESIRIYAITTTVLAIFLRVWRFDLFSSEWLSEAMVAIVVFYILYDKRAIRIPMAFALVGIIILSMPMDSYGHATILLILLAGGAMWIQRYKYAWLLILAINIIPYTKGREFEPIFLFYGVLLGATYFKKWRLSVAKLSLLFIFGIVLYSHAQYAGDKMFVAQIATSINKVSTKLITQNQNRPIQYVENFVDIKTPLDIRLGTTLEILMHYFTKTIAPYPLSFYYGYSFIRPMKVSDPIPLLSLGIHMLLLILALYFWRRDRLISFGILLYLVAIVVFSNFQRSIPGMVADRYLLTPSLGWIIILVCILQGLFRLDLSKGLERLSGISPYARYTFAAVLLLYSVATFSRNNDWKDYLTLFRHDIRYMDQSSQAHNLLALRLMILSYNVNNAVDQTAMREEALGHFKRAIEICPPFFNATYDVARVYLILNKQDSAITYLRKAVEMDSTFADASVALGDIYAAKGQSDEALKYYYLAVVANPEYETMYDKLNTTFFVQKDYRKVIEINHLEIVKIPKIIRPYINVAKAYYALKQKDSTAIWLKKALEVNPGDKEADQLLHNLQAEPK